MLKALPKAQQARWSRVGEILEVYLRPLPVREYVSAVVLKSGPSSATPVTRGQPEFTLLGNARIDSNVAVLPAASAEAIALPTDETHLQPALEDDEPLIGGGAPPDKPLSVEPETPAEEADVESTSTRFAQARAHLHAGGDPFLASEPPEQVVSAVAVEPARSLTPAPEGSAAAFFQGVPWGGGSNAKPTSSVVAPVTRPASPPQVEVNPGARVAASSTRDLVSAATATAIAASQRAATPAPVAPGTRPDPAPPNRLSTHDGEGSASSFFRSLPWGG